MNKPSFITVPLAPLGAGLRAHEASIIQERNPYDPDDWISVTGRVRLSGSTQEIIALIKRLEQMPLLANYSTNLGGMRSEVTLELRARYQPGSEEASALAPILALQRKALP